MFLSLLKFFISDTIPVIRNKVEPDYSEIQEIHLEDFTRVFGAPQVQNEPEEQ
jgi:hypothetical protein